MQIPDLINGLVEIVGAYFTWKNALAIYQSKEIKGVYWPSTVFFTVWGLWNLYFYPTLNQWLSFIGGVFLVAGNICWVTLAIYYLFFKKTKYEFTEKDLLLSVDEYDNRYTKPAAELLMEQIDAEATKDREFCEGTEWDEGFKRRIKKAVKRKKGTSSKKKKNNGNARKHRPGRISKDRPGSYNSGCYRGFA